MGATSFSAAARETVWAELGEQPFDLLVIGGGITGVGVAHDTAGRGLRVALIEAGDIGTGTSSRSSRLIHGGLRYLETFEFSLVFEALKERRRLLELAPHLVRPIPFLFPVYRGDATGLAKLTAGMWLYESLSLFQSPTRHRTLGHAGVLSLEPGLRSRELSGGAIYYDAQVNDARLTLAVARAAHEAGAAVLTYARVVGAQPRQGQVGRVLVRDQLSDREIEVQARLMLNAGGPWSDRIRLLADPSASPKLRTTKGAHILLTRERVENRNAIIFRSPVDGRVMFVLPWGAFTYVGTTDTEFEGDPADAVADPNDVRYLLDSANHIFPGAALSTSDVVSTWAGVRPLLAPARTALTASATSREHAIWRDRSGLLNVAGGKLTTFRSMAAEVGDVAAEILAREFRVASGRFFTEFLPLPGTPEGGDMNGLVERLLPRSRAMGIADDVIRGVAGRHGSETAHLLDLAEGDRQLATRLIPSLDYLLVEAVFAVRSELSLSLEDVLRRRLQVFYEMSDGGMGIAEQVARTIARESALAWDEAEVQKQIECYAELVRRTRAFPKV